MPTKYGELVWAAQLARDEETRGTQPTGCVLLRWRGVPDNRLVVKVYYSQPNSMQHLEKCKQGTYITWATRTLPAVLSYDIDRSVVA